MTAAIATNTSAASRRATLIKLIHVAKRELGQQHGLDDVAYRQILVSVGKDSSLKTMGVPGMVAVLEHLKSKGFQVRPKAGDRRQAVNPGASKVRALWLFLHQLGEVRDPSEKALAAYVKRIAKVDDLHWASGKATDTLIETLKKWAMRVLPGAIKALADEVLGRHRAQPLDALQLAVFLRAANASVNYEGFDHHLWAWQDLMELLGRPVGGAGAVPGGQAEIRPETRTSIRRHELLADLADVVTRRLKDNGVSPNEAEIVANDLADHLAKHWGGQVIPFPKDLRRELTRLELEIYGKFLGDNYDDLARQYGMAMSGMRKLIARIRAKLAADTQHDLFYPARAA